MKLNPRVTRTGVELVKRFEGLRRRAARLPDGGWTIGYGHTLSAREGAEVSPEDAEALLYYDLSEVAGKLEAWTFTPLNQNQFEALSAFTFNIGLENFRHSTVLKRVNEGQHLLAGAAMELWRKADFNGEDLVVDALVRRRAAEKAHYLTPPEGFRPAPSPVLRPTFDHSVIEAAAQAQAARHVTVVDVPLEGENAVALVEHSPEEARSVEVSPVQPAAVHAPTPLVLESPEEREPHHAEPTANTGLPVNDRTALEAPRFPGAGSSEFRGFEPPPRRYDLGEIQARPVTQEAANEAVPNAPALAPAPLEPTVPTQPEGPPTSGFNLFDQPLAPPSLALPLQGIRSVRLSADADASVTGPAARLEEATETLRAGLSGKVNTSHMLLFGSIGVLGVFLFSVAVGNMAFGKASSATVGALLMGILGIALMIPSGVWFLMLRLNGAQDEAKAETPAEAQA